ncbi:MAG: iditol 2-dehydrogenase [Candidatus Rokubacteria bacterium GWC2_70_16]|nr:MAG: iditol 2-dehydrogenase [Candidatus Rokubacteria bacterium GWC2_70_16]OGL20013.1 MAG: iditol 2-dehydrogenase [Candidatus Rokubacteria bacterium RIFCSPLOWO2_12_FULL_71_19]
MRGVVFLGERELALRDFPDPTPGPGEVVIAMKASGMCGSDLHPYRASRQGGAAAALGLGGKGEPVIAGHEPCGVVAARGPGVSAEEAPTGMRVMIHHYRGCGRCRHCRSGWSQLCPQGIVVYGVTGHGGHAHFMKVPASTLVPLPDALTFEEGAAISCGTGTAYGALKRLGVSGRDTVAVFGQGPVGLSATMLGAAMGARMIAVDPVAERRRLAEELGAAAVIDPGAVDPVAALHDLTHGEGVDGAMECAGSPEARVATVRSVRTWGQACFVGEGGTVTLEVSPHLLRRQVTLHASWTFSTVGQEECARFVASRKIPLHRLLTHRFSLEQAAEAYRLFDTQTTGKGVFLP